MAEREHGWAYAPDARMLTGATVITIVRTLGAPVLAFLATPADTDDAALRLLVASLVTYWVGDILDGA